MPKPVKPIRYAHRTCFVFRNVTSPKKMTSRNQNRNVNHGTRAYHKGGEGPAAKLFWGEGALPSHGLRPPPPRLPPHPKSRMRWEPPPPPPRRHNQMVDAQGEGGNGGELQKKVKGGLLPHYSPIVPPLCPHHSPSPLHHTSGDSVCSSRAMSTAEGTATEQACPPHTHGTGPCTMATLGRLSRASE